MINNKSDELSRGACRVIRANLPMTIVKGYFNALYLDMEPIYIEESPMLGVKSIMIYGAVLNDDDSHYPIKVNDKDYILKMNEKGFWAANGISEELSIYIGEIVERNDI